MVKEKLKIGQIVRHEGMQLAGDNLLDYSMFVKIEEFLENGLVLVTDKDGEEYEIKESSLIADAI